MGRVLRKLSFPVHCVFAAVAALLCAHPAAGALIVVNDAGFAVANDGKCTLVEAITAANSDTSSGAAAGECVAGPLIAGANQADVISIVPAGTTISALVAVDAAEGGNAFPSITSAITIQGNGAILERGAAALPANTWRFFRLATGGRLRLYDLTLRGARWADLAGSSRGGAAIALTAGAGNLLEVYDSFILDNDTATSPNNLQHLAAIGSVNSGTHRIVLCRTLLQDNDNPGGFGGALTAMATTTLLYRSTFRNNTSGNGGAVWLDGGPHEIAGSVFAGNTAASNGSGGALYLNGGAVQISDTSIVANTATSAGFGGGGIFSGSARLVARNVTISGNSATRAGALQAGGTADFFNSSIIDNDGAEAVHLTLSTAKQVRFANTVIANTAGAFAGAVVNCRVSGTALGLGANFASSGYNLADDATCGLSVAKGDQPSAAPQLGALAQNGGHAVPPGTGGLAATIFSIPPTHAPAAGSPVIDLGYPGSGAGEACQPRDARGVARPTDGDGAGGARCDIGAFELAPSAALVAEKSAALAIDPDGNLAITPGDTVRYTIAIRNLGAAAAAAVSVSDTVDANSNLLCASLTSVSCTGGFGGNFTKSVGAIAGASSASFTFDVVVKAAPVGQLVDQAAVSATSIAPFNTDDPCCSVAFGDPTETPVISTSALIGDFVWRDYDADGVQDAGEPGAGAVVVRLRDSTGTTILATTSTDAGGLYSFAVAAGTYIVEVVAPAGLGFSPKDATGDDSDSDVNAGTGRMDAVTLAAGEIVINRDAGLTGTTLGDRLWIDANGNGIQDAAETSGVALATVELLDAGGTTVLQSTVTDLTGRYYFSGVANGTYVVRFQLPAGFVAFTLQDQGADAADSDVDPATGRVTVTVAGGASNLTIDAGVLEAATIGNFVWRDDGDGVQEAGEPGISGVTVRLLDSTGTTTIQTKTTDASGFYFLSGVSAGNYVVEFVLPAGHSFAPRDAGGNDLLDSDADGSTGRTAVLTLAAGEVNVTIDAGMLLAPSLGDYVWDDTNGNGVQNGGEPGHANVTVRLLDGLGALLATTTTNASGLYAFNNLTAGSTYIVEFVAPAGFAFTTPDQGADTTDSDPNPANGRTASITFLAGSGADTTFDAGLVPAADLGDLVWRDSDGDGIRDAGEPGLAGVTVNLYLLGNPVASTVTDANGNYVFADRAPGNYVLEFVNPNASLWRYSPTDQGGNDAIDSDANPIGQTSPYALNGTDILTIDAGFVPLGSISDFVWLDGNANGIQDLGEPGIDGVTVRLFTGPTLVTTTVTAGGVYSFTGVAPGDYSVEFVAPANHEPAAQDQGGDDTRDSDADATGRTAVFTLSDGANDQTRDAGFVAFGSIGDRVWRDDDGDGLQDGGEPGLDGVQVSLSTGAGAFIASTTTAGGGLFAFDDRPAGSYRLQFNAPAGFAFSPNDAGIDTIDSDADPSDGRVTFTLVAGTDDTSRDAGLMPLLTIGDRVWRDDDADGVQDAGEPGLDGITVRLLDDAATILATTTTAGGGMYAFANRPPAAYAIEVVNPNAAIYRFTLQDQGGDDALDSDVDATTGRTATFNVFGSSTGSVDAGLVPLAQIGDFVWQDTDGDGVQDGGEPGVGGVTVNLLNGGGSPIASTTTASSGAYAFTQPPGTYIVEFVAPAGFAFTAQDQGGDDALDSDANPLDGRTAPFAVPAGVAVVDATRDAGLIGQGVVGDRVWQDDDGDGIQDGGEPGVDGVTVRLLTSAAVLAKSTTTAGGGSYAFTGIAPGSYIVEVIEPAGFDFSPQDQGADDALDSDVTPATGRSDAFVVSAASATTLDAGLAPLASIGDRVWRDDNGNGIQDGGESGIDGVSVRLYTAGGTLLQSTTTAGGGLYTFSGQAAGSYRVEFVAPAGFRISPADQGGDDALDSDPDPVTGRTAAFVLSSANDTSRDAGLMPLASIGDRLWRDDDGDGVQDAGEPGLDGITVRLLDASATVLSTTVTGGGGLYSFPSLAPATYAIEFVNPNAFLYQISPQDQGGNDTFDSDVDATTGRTAPFNFFGGVDDDTRDAGFIPLAQLGDSVWLDANGNGLHEGGEPGVAGVTVNLLTSGGALLESTTTAPNGFYAFHRAPGSYLLEFVAPTGFQFTARDLGGDDAIDSDADTATGRTAVIALSPAVDDLTNDAGLIGGGTIGDRVWRDDDGDGIQDAAEPGLDGVTLHLRDSGNALIATATTAGGGAYAFTSVTPGMYSVEIELPAGFAVSPLDQGGDDTADNDVDSASNRTALFTLTASSAAITDAGLMPLGAIGDRVWRDDDGDGIQDAAEAGLDGVTVQLQNAGGLTLTSTVTAGGGAYSFAALAPGDYRLVFVQPAGFRVSPMDQGADDTADSDADPITGQTAVFNVSGGSTDTTRDAGMMPLASIGDRVWRDDDGDGIQDAGEPGIDGVNVRLLDAGGAQVGSTTTAGGGLFTFASQPPATYILEVLNPNVLAFAITQQDQGGDDDADSDVDPTTPRTAPFTLLGGTSDDTRDAGLVPLAAIGDRVWQDNDQDGVFDAGEPGIAGITVNLLTGGGAFLATTTTGPAGLYEFRRPPGTYLVEFVKPPGYDFSPLDQGGDDTRDSDADMSTGRTAAFTLASAVDDTTIDAGLTPEGVLGDRVWRDVNGNGLQDGGEPGIDGVTVMLLDGTTQTTISTTTTAGGGAYTFSDLPPASYRIAFVLPAGFGFTDPDQGSDDALDSDADPGTGRTAPVAVGAVPVTSVDAGLVPASIIGDRVWRDDDGDGIQDAGETGVAGVTVHLLDAGGALLQTTMTGLSGDFAFHRGPGSYMLRFHLPLSGFVFTARDAGSDDALDSDADPVTGRTAVFTTLPSTDDLTLDAGLAPLASIGGRVWNDDSQDGIHQPAETAGLFDVTVRLFDATGTTLLRTAATNAAGDYAFVDVPPGTYLVEFVLPNGYDFSPAGQDSDADATTGRTGPVLVTGSDVAGIDAGMFPTPLPPGVIGLAKNAVPAMNEVAFVFTLEAFAGDVQNIQVTDDLGAAFPGRTFTVSGLASPTLTVNPSFDGITNQQLLSGIDDLSAGATATIVFTVTFSDTSSVLDYTNTATAAAQDLQGNALSDASQSGLDPDPDGDGDPLNDNAQTAIAMPAPPSADIPALDSLALLLLSMLLAACALMLIARNGG